MYNAANTRLDIAVATSMLALHVESPSMKHQKAVGKLVKYLKTTPKFGLMLAAREVAS